MKYIIVTTARSGSSYLCDLLTTYGIGKPDEYLNNGLMPKSLRESKGRPNSGLVDNEVDAFRDFSMKLINRHTVDDVFGIKILAPQFFNASIQRSKAIENILMDTDKYIFLERRDKVKQSISRYIALHTGSWHDRQRPKGIMFPEYDYLNIYTGIQQTLAFEKAWVEFLVFKGIDFKHLIYENYISNEKEAVISIAEYLNVEPLAFARDDTYLRGTQSTDLNREFLERFSEDFLRIHREDFPWERD